MSLPKEVAQDSDLVHRRQLVMRAHLGYHHRMSTSDQWNEIEPGRYQHAERPGVVIEACQVTERRRRRGEIISETYEGWGLVIDGKPEASYRTLVDAKRAAKSR